MTYDQLFSIAIRGGSVRWERSGAVERLSLSRRRLIVASAGGKKHVIHTQASFRLPHYDCVEITTFDLKAVAVKAGETFSPAALPELAPGVQGIVLDEPDGFYIPVITAKQPGSGEVAQFLDALPRDKRIVFSTMLSRKLEGMLQRRGFKKTVLRSDIGHRFDALERKATP